MYTVPSRNTSTDKLFILVSVLYLVQNGAEEHCSDMCTENTSQVGKITVVSL